MTAPRPEHRRATRPILFPGRTSPIVATRSVTSLSLPSRRRESPHGPTRACVGSGLMSEGERAGPPDLASIGCPFAGCRCCVRRPGGVLQLERAGVVRSWAR